MFVRQLIISKPAEVVRDITFEPGLNLIVDDTPIDDSKRTGNNVGKTTVLKLIDFCLGTKPNIIYTDTENKKEVYDVVKDYLIEERIKITLLLIEDFSDVNSKRLLIERNFLQKKEAIRKINGIDILEKDFEDELKKHIIPENNTDKPSFRQIISHNIRYKDESINNTLRTLDKFTSDIEYETLYLYMLGCTFNEGAKKQALFTKINQEEAFKERLEKKQTKNTYEIALNLINDEIDRLNERKHLFNLNETLEQDLDQLNAVKYQINKTSSLIGKLEIRKDLIEQSKIELEKSISNIDLQQLKLLYTEATSNISGIQKTFEDLVSYHNTMIIEKAKFISQDLPRLLSDIASYRNNLSLLLDQEKELTSKISKGDSFEELEKIIFELNEKYRLKGEYESIISQITDVESNIKYFNDQMQVIDEYLYSGDFESILKEQIKKFNRYFSDISQKLYGERYALTFEKVTNKKGRQYYKFTSFNANLSSGKKQGEILCFDLAYILFADEEKISCLHFLLNDKKELMHDNQLINVADFVKNKNIQLIVSILKDKLPPNVLEKAYIPVELSQKDKLFRIE